MIAIFLGMLSIIIPAYNEEKRIGETIKQIQMYVKKLNKFENRAENKIEIIVVDDGSTDKTYEIASAMGVKVLRNKINKGKGYSVKRGMLAAKYDRILFTDADNATPIFELGKFLKVGADIVIGSRNLPGSKIMIKQNPLREFMGRIFPYFVKLLVLKDFQDTQCGFKLFNKVGKKIANLQKIDGFCFDVEQLYIAKKLDYSVKEVPISWYNKGGSKVRIGVDIFKMLIDLIRIKFLH